MGKVIFVLLDACRYDVLTNYAGYLEETIRCNKGAKYRVRSGLPSLSRPAYETLMTGLSSTVHQIKTNDTVRRSSCENIFSLCTKAGKVTAAAAYDWFSELYARSPFDPHRDRYQLDGKEDIGYGIYYYVDNYPDSHLFGDGIFLKETYHPDFLVIHAMNIDDQGHKHGSESIPYAGAVLLNAERTGYYLDEWINDGYQVVITADHGMDTNHLHGGISPEQTQVPLYIYSPACVPGDYTESEISQLNIAPLLCRLLGLSPAEGMLEDLDIKMV